MRTNESSSKLLKNLGFDEDFFEKIEKEPVIYLIKKEKMRKVGSENAVLKIEKSEISPIKCREAEDLEMYQEVEECGLFDVESNQKEGFGDRFIRDSNYISRESNCFDDCDGVNMVENNLKIFKNCSESQMNQLNQIFSEMNSSKEEKVLVKAYKSKLKTKFYQIYEKNSQQFQEKIKYKIFHKCNFPSCGRTFASSGWLRSHFNEHLKELKKNKFNILYENCIEKFTFRIV